MKKIKFSIIIPVFNTGTPLKKCVDSILNQPYDDYEIVLVNDGSTDSITLQLLDMYKANNKIIVINKANGGCLTARKYGIIHSTAQYIMFGDSDDFFDSHYMQVVHEITQNDADLYILNNYLNEVGTTNFYKEKNFDKDGFVQLDWLFDQFLHMRMNAVWDKIYKRELFGKNVDILSDTITFGDDAYINNQYLRFVTRVYISDNAVFYHYVDSETSVCKSPATLKRLEDISIVFNSLENIKNLPYATHSRIEAFRDFYYGYFVRTIVALKKNGITNTQINESITQYRIMSNINPMNGKSIKGIVYRIILKKKLYSLAKIICTREEE